MNFEQIDFERQAHFLDPHQFNSKNLRIDVIGAGATGSYVVLQLAKMGIKNIHVWDNDEVESHNLPNQLYGVGDVGKPKVEALKQLIKSITDIDIITHKEFVDSSTGTLGDVVFLLTDTMASRKEIYESCLKYSLTKICVETRLSATQGRVYTFNPTDIVGQTRWEKTLYSDDQAETSECGTKLMMGASSSMVASMAVWQFIKWTVSQKDQTEEKVKIFPEFELLFSVCPNFNFMYRV